MNKERLIKLKEFLSTVDVNRFNMKTWFETTDVDESCDMTSVFFFDVEDDEEQLPHFPVKEVSCGTAACAMGWACMIPEFQKEGLQLVCPESEYPRNKFQGTPIYNDGKNVHSEFGACVEFFDITWKQAYYLFDPSEYDPKIQDTVRPRHVISRIDDVLEGIV